MIDGYCGDCGRVELVEVEEETSHGTEPGMIERFTTLVCPLCLSEDVEPLEDFLKRKALHDEQELNFKIKRELLTGEE